MKELNLDVLSVVVQFMDDYTLFFFTLLCRDFYTLRKVQKRDYDLLSFIKDKRITVDMYKLLRKFSIIKVDRPLIYCTNNWKVINYMVENKHHRFKGKIDEVEMKKFTFRVVDNKMTRYFMKAVSDRYVNKNYLLKSSPSLGKFLHDAYKNY